MWLKVRGNGGICWHLHLSHVAICLKLIILSRARSGVIRWPTGQKNGFFRGNNHQFTAAIVSTLENGEQIYFSHCQNTYKMLPLWPDTAGRSSLSLGHFQLLGTSYLLYSNCTDHTIRPIKPGPRFRGPRLTICFIFGFFTPAQRVVRSDRGRRILVSSR